MHKRWIWLATAALAAIMLIVAACGGDNDDGTTADGQASDDVNEISMTMSDELSFDPNRVEVRVGEPVRLAIGNSGTALHDFTVESIDVQDVMAEGGSTTAAGGHGATNMAEYDLHVAIAGGDSATLDFTPMAAGEYEFMCTVTGHADGGMTGTLVVTE